MDSASGLIPYSIATPSPPAEVRAEFSNDTALHIYVGENGQPHVLIYDASGQLVTSKARARCIDIPSVNALPQPAPISPDETILNDRYVRHWVGSALAPQHFRNQLRVFREYYHDFCAEVESTWPGLQVLELNEGAEQLSLHVRDRDFVAEIAQMGHGLQMWMQVMWFVVRSRQTATAVFDEPDVYMHADLQRRLIRLLRNRFPQVIIMTHSTEIISEVDPSEIVIVDRRRRASTAATSLTAVQRIVNSFGSVHNIGLARLWSSKVFVVTEGKDLSLLKVFQEKLFPGTQQPVDALPNMSVGGWGGWNDVVASTRFLTNALGERVIVHCIFDKDYHSPEQIKERQEEADLNGIALHVWTKKELESYLLVPAAISRLISRRISDSAHAPTPETISSQLFDICIAMEDDIIKALGQEFLSSNKRGGFPAAMEQACKVVEQAKRTLDSLLAIAPAKDVISSLSEWAQEEYGVSISPRSIAYELQPSEIADEVATVLRAVEEDTAASSR